MKTIAINIKTDPKVKKQAQKLAEELGLSLSAVVTGLLKQFIRTKEFSVSTGYRATPALEEAIRQSEADFKAGNFAGPFETIAEMDRHLDSL